MKRHEYEPLSRVSRLGTPPAVRGAMARMSIHPVVLLAVLPVSVQALHRDSLPPSRVASAIEVKMAPAVPDVSSLLEAEEISVENVPVVVQPAPRSKLVRFVALSPAPWWRARAARIQAISTHARARSASSPRVLLVRRHGPQHHLMRAIRRAPHVRRALRTTQHLRS
jgi:hypothetical protein